MVAEILMLGLCVAHVCWGVVGGMLRGMCLYHTCLVCVYMHMEHVAGSQELPVHCTVLSQHMNTHESHTASTVHTVA